MNDQTSFRARHQLRRPDRFFFGTRGLPCPYLPERVEPKVVTVRPAPDAVVLYEKRSRAGFRRSHSLAYRPACPGCEACIPVRIPVAKFELSSSFARIVKTNSDIEAHDS